jgi:hypothetical protein
VLSRLSEPDLRVRLMRRLLTMTAEGLLGVGVCKADLRKEAFK